MANKTVKKISSPSVKRVKLKPDEFVVDKATFPAFYECVKIRELKGKDYNGGKVTFDDYFPFGQKSYTQMVYMKALRLVSLVEKDGEPNFEGIDDSILDLIVYANQFFKARKEGKV